MIDRQADRDRQTDRLTLSSCKSLKADTSCIVEQLLEGTTDHSLSLIVTGRLERGKERGRGGGREGREGGIHIMYIWEHYT